MGKRTILVTLAVAALVAAFGATVWASSPWSPWSGRPTHGYGPGSGYGPGMMGGPGGGYGPGQGHGPGTMGGPGQGYGPGMMGDSDDENGRGQGYGPGTMGGPGQGYGPGMMGGRYGLPGDGNPVDSLEGAHGRAQLFADRLGLKVSEVMQFSNGFYAELHATDGSGGTEVLIDPDNGAVSVEYGPAMMWNTEYGMHPGGTGSPRVSSGQARDIAQRWLDDQHTGLTVGEPDVFPGYVTLHTLRQGKIVSMMSVNSYTGQVWYHTWHGRYIAMSEG